jgi:molybdopterin-guanine dinucleotide biosynthesis protein A
MGRDKAALPFHGDTLLGRAVRLVARVAEDVVVVARPGQDLPPLPEGVRVVRDEVLDRGPLGGLAPGLRASLASACFVTSCDAPHLRPAVARLLFDRLGEAAVAFAEAEGRVQPLCSVYRTSVAADVEALLGAGRLRPVFLADEVPVVRVPEGDLRAADPDLASLANCNTREAYEAVLAAPPPRVRVELFDVARLRAGRESVDVGAATLAEAVSAAAAACPGLVPEIVLGGVLSPHFRASLGGERFVDDPLTPLVPGDSVLLLSAQSGG